jgi:phenylalanyl-tRNA synthetase beta chain
VTDANPQTVERPVFSMPAERISSYLGIPVKRDQAVSALEKLGYRCSADLSSIEVPTRRVDVNDAVVLIEDVARVIGYDAITGAPSAETPTAGGTTALDAARQTLRGLLNGNGFLELRGVPLEPLEGEATFSQIFSQIKGDSIALTNPLNADLARLRRSLVPFLLKTAEHNAKRRSTTFRYFEIDKIFSRPSAEPEERWALGILLGGALNDSDWSTRRDVDLFDLKGIVESILETLRAPRASFSPDSLPGYAEGTAARVTVKGAPVGLIGQISPELLAPRKIQTAVFAAELFLAKLVPEARSSAAFEPLPRFPAVFRDLSFVVKTGIAYASIEHAIRSAAGPNLETLDCIDVFDGKGIAKDSRSVAVSMVFRAPDRTLSSEEVTAEVDQIVARLGTEFGAELRSR